MARGIELEQKNLFLDRFPNARWQLDEPIPLTVGRYIVRINWSGELASARIEVQVREGETERPTVVMKPRGILVRVVDDSTREPIDGAWVAARGDHRAGMTSSEDTTYLGQTFLRGYPAGEYELEVVHPSYTGLVAEGRRSRFENSDRLLGCQCVGDVMKVDARYELRRRHVGQQFPQRFAFSFGVHVPHGVDQLERTVAVQHAPHVLCVASFEARKNLITLIEGYGKAKARGLAMPLTVVASPRSGDSSPVFQAIEQNGLRSSVSFRADVPDDELQMLYQTARIAVSPSLAEGFGLVPLEAMAAGVPVVASDIPSHREVLGDAARFFSAGLITA